jgi:hypothetical protein
MGLFDFAEELYWRWTEGRLVQCPVCGNIAREHALRGSCEHQAERIRKEREERQ